MKHKLSTKAAAPYTALESKAFAALAAGKRLSTTELAASVYGRKRLLNPRQAVTSLLRTLARKLAHNREPFRLQRTERSGPHAVVHWLENEKRPG